MKLSLQIAGLKILIIDYPFSRIQKELYPFVYEFKADEADFVCKVDIYDVPPIISGELKLTKSNREFYKSKDDLCFVYKIPYAEGEMKYYTIFQLEKKTSKLLIPQNYIEAYFDEKLFLEILVFNFVILNFSRIMIHASVIEYNSEVILFSGSSGKGKSTQAGLWEKYKNAKILNGDRGILYIREDYVEVFGSPFAGSSDIYINESAPLKAIILLEQSVDNKFERLSPKMAYKYLYPRIAIPNWDKEWTLKCVSMMEKIMELVPIYRLTCTADKRAVDLVYNKLYCGDN